MSIESNALVIGDKTFKVSLHTGCETFGRVTWSVKVDINGTVVDDYNCVKEGEAIWTFNAIVGTLRNVQDAFINSPSPNG